jgi:DNA polymerase
MTLAWFVCCAVWMITAMIELHGDFESRSPVSPSDVGLHNYIFHPETEPLFFWYRIGEGDYKCWRIWECQPMLDELQNALHDPDVKIVAYNSAFERYMFLKLHHEIPASRFIDPQVGGRYLSLPASLDVQGDVLGLPANLSKDKHGEELIKLFSEKVVVKATKKNPGRTYYNDWNSHPKEWQEFLEYGRQDVVAEGELLRRMRILRALPLPEFEQKLWLLDQKINDRGMPTDVDFVTKMYKLAVRAKQEAKENFEKMTGVNNANSPDQIKKWAKTQGYPYGTLRKDTVTSVLKDPEIKLTDTCRAALKMRAEAASTSYQKLGKILETVSPDGRLRGQFIFMGSPRCGRWSGNAVQLHNMARPALVGGYDFEDQKVIKEARAMIYAEDYEGIKAKYGSVLLVVKSLIRTVFVAP